jgi:hypothetical protein
VCAPVSLVVGALVGTTVYSGEQSRKAASKSRQQAADMAAADDKARAEADAKAVQNANLRLAADQRRRREQQSLISTGAPASEADAGASPISKTTNRSTVSQRASLLTRGQPPTPF